MDKAASEKSFRYLDACCFLIAQKAGGKPIAQWTNSDYVLLSGKLLRHTQVSISANTLKRIFGKLKTTERYYPQKATRDALAQYAGFEYWDDFAAKNIQPEVQETARVSTPAPPVRVQKKDNRSRYYKRFTLLIAGIFIALTAVYLAGNQGGDDLIRATLEGTNTQGQTPNSVSFKVKLPKGADASADQFTMNFGDGRAEKTVNKSLSITHYYEMPGRYNAVLKYKGRPIDSVMVYTTTNGWEVAADMMLDTTRVYPIEDAALNNLPYQVSTAQLIRAGVDTNKTFFVHFDNIHPSQINGDNFELTTTVKTSPNRAGVRCSQVDLVVFGESSRLKVTLIKKGCVSWANLVISENILDGERNNLSFLGADLRNGGNIVLKSEKQQFSLFLNGKKLYQTTYKMPLKKVYGAGIMFAGLGTITDFRLRDLDNGSVF